MKARRNFFIENFPKKMFDILDSYNFQQFKVDDQTIKTFHARFSSLIRSKVK